MLEFEFHLLSINQTLCKESVSLAVLPGVEGDFGIMAKHTPMISKLKAGTIALYRAGEIYKTFDITSGYAQVNSEECVVLVNE